ncbi:hypothetical protein PR002_g32852, partial [Phytophthora rubi]
MQLPMPEVLFKNLSSSVPVPVEEIMTTTFNLFVGLSLIAGALLAYDTTCAGPYKVMNSNHQHSV